MSKALVQKIIETDNISTESFFTQKHSVYSYLNPVSYLIARKQKNVFLQLDGIMVDGFILVSAIRFIYRKRIQRRTFDMGSIAPSFFDFAISKKKTVYIIGGTQRDIENAISILREQYPRLAIVGYRNGYFSSQSEKTDEYSKIRQLNIDYVIVGMGIIQQEVFLLELKSSGYKGIGISCGGFISQLSMKGLTYYPEWINKYNLRFLYRFYKEKHTRKRYLKAAFLFPILFVWDKIKYKIQEKRQHQ